MTQTVNVASCFERAGGGYTITFKIGTTLLTAASDQPVQPGADVTVRDGRVIA
ncbi:hypothetical protein HNP32_003443 [Brevundimonas bullata]|uniref:Uncharacterized protein n=1 Tax=Brevundimonas bullata TaxID=13160 RepID=A0A7W7N4P2_9CAUL|nr:hypothetical protein [Brevundimonas bullata]MBB6384695.1 hypothetical protein [Brevundimonas bullata]